MSELQGPRIPGEERSGRRRPLGWIIGGLIALLLLALLIPFACQALGGGSQGEGSGAQEGTTGAQGNDRAQGAGGAGETPDSGSGADNKTGEAGGGSNISARLVSIGEVRSSDGTTVTIPRATIAGTDGWIAIHQDAGGEPKVPQSIGHAPLREGANTDIKIKLDRRLTSSQRLYAMVHTEDPADGRYTFPSGDPPAKASGEKVVVESFSYMMLGGQARDDVSREQAQAGGAKPLPETGGMSPAVLLLVGTILLLTGSAGLSAAVRRPSASRG